MNWDVIWKFIITGLAFWSIARTFRLEDLLQYIITREEGKKK